MSDLHFKENGFSERELVVKEVSGQMGHQEYGEIGGDVTVRPDDSGAHAEPEAHPFVNTDLRGISINPLNSGYMVKVGCQSVAVETTEKLMYMLNKYLTDPADFERKWYSKDVRNRLENI